MRIVNAQVLLPVQSIPPSPWQYQLLVEEVVSGSLFFESYGFAVSCPETGERAQVENVTIDQPFALKLLSLLSQNQVSPIHLRDVLEDALALPGGSGLLPSSERPL